MIMNDLETFLQIGFIVTVYLIIGTILYFGILQLFGWLNWLTVGLYCFFLLGTIGSLKEDY